MKKVSAIIILCVLCFLATLSLRKYGLIGGEADDSSQFSSEKYELQESDVDDIDKMGILQRLDRERTLLINSITPSVVCIATEGVQQVRNQRSGTINLAATRGIGSGVIATHQGHIITNHHVKL